MPYSLINVPSPAFKKRSEGLDAFLSLLIPAVAASAIRVAAADFAAKFGSFG